MSHFVWKSSCGGVNKWKRTASSSQVTQQSGHWRKNCNCQLGDNSLSLAPTHFSTWQLHSLTRWLLFRDQLFRAFLIQSRRNFSVSFVRFLKLFFHFSWDEPRLIQLLTLFISLGSEPYRSSVHSARWERIKGWEGSHVSLCSRCANSFKHKLKN